MLEIFAYRTVTVMRFTDQNWISKTVYCIRCGMVCKIGFTNWNAKIAMVVTILNFSEQGPTGAMVFLCLYPSSRRNNKSATGITLALVYRNTWLGNIIIFIIKQIGWTYGHVDLTVHNTDISWNMLIKFSKQIGNSFAKIINTKVN